MNPIPSAETAAWNIADGIKGGQPIVLRYRPELHPFLGDARYPRRLSITWNYPCDNSSGMPSHLQSDEMQKFEDLLQAHLDADGTAILAFVRTHAGSRSWIYYIADAQLLAQRINAALANHPDFPIELEVADDPEWTGLKTILESCK
jgi:hypothetical protein